MANSYQDAPRGPLLALAIAALALLWGTKIALGQAEDAAAVVNGKDIARNDVETAFRRTSFAKKPLNPELSRKYREHVLRLLINDELVNQFLDQRKVEADDKKVDDHIARISAELKKQGKTLAGVLQELGTDESAMRADIRNIHRWIAFVDGQATGETIRKYFAQNQTAFDGTLVRASHVLVRAESDASAEEKTAARGKIERIKAQLAGGVSFAEAAKAHSDCPSKQMGGDLDYFPRKGVMAEPFAAAAFALRIGEVSDIVETEFGYHLIKVTGRKPGTSVELAKVSDEVKGAYAEDLRVEVIAKMRDKAKIVILR